jgi:glycosyltransferase involved in cell wall biosynthesis
MGWEDAFVLLSLRAWEPLYGVDVVVRAFCRAACEVPELRLVLLGGGSQAAELRRLLEQAGMTERVWFGGQVSNTNLAEFYRLADVYVSAAYSDGSSVSLMEALACGRPSVVTDIPSNAEWVQTGEHGWRFPAGDADALAAVMVRAAQDRAALARMGSAARRLAEERADWKKNFQKLLAAYDLAVQTQAKRRAER